jgi:hypothetical protein
MGERDEVKFMRISSGIPSELWLSMLSGVENAWSSSTIIDR